MRNPVPSAVSYSAFWSPYRKLPDGTWEALGTETETLSGAVRPEPLTERLYTGREWDSETGLHHYRARAYSPELWRFLQRDPAWQSDQMNPYAYVRNNPMMWTDPTGMWSDATNTRLWWAAKIWLWFWQSLAGWWLTLAGAWACSTWIGCIAGAPAAVYWVDQVIEWQALVSDGVRQLWSWGEVSQATDFATRFNPVSWWLNRTGLGCESKAIIKTVIDIGATWGVRTFWRAAATRFWKIPQWVSKEQFELISQTIRKKAWHISDDIAIHGSRARGAARSNSDLDIAIRVSDEVFEKWHQMWSWNGNAASVTSAAHRTARRAMEVGKIQAWEFWMSSLRSEIVDMLWGMKIDISLIRIGGQFDKGPYINLFK